MLTAISEMNGYQLPKREPALPWKFIMAGAIAAAFFDFAVIAQYDVSWHNWTLLGISAWIGISITAYGFWSMWWPKSPWVRKNILAINAVRGIAFILLFLLVILACLDLVIH